ncbi:MAG: membrane integrity-associated transporter subunit PqiC [Opitutae bacterium]|nr:membrane integrity-associated transporter subunit PqiC [Opitutae bacterium]
MNFSSSLRFGLAAAAAALLAGCNILPEARPESARYYVLEAHPAADAPPAGAVKLGLRPVEVPAYLKHKAIVTRSGENEVSYAADAFWAEPLDAGIARVLREQLAARANILAYPFPAQLPRDYDLTVRVLNAEGAAKGVRFVAVIELLRVGDKPEVVVRREFTAPAAAWHGDYGQLARGLSEAVAALADDIVASVPKQ